MKVLPIVGLLFCIIMCMGCGGKKTKKELTGECKAVEILNSGLEKSISCIAGLSKVPPSTAIGSKQFEVCGNFTEYAKGAVLVSEEQGEIKVDFFDNFEKKIKKKEGETGTFCEVEYNTMDTKSLSTLMPYEKYRIKGLIKVEELKGLTECWQDLWNNVYPELKTQYNCN